MSDRAGTIWTLILLMWLGGAIRSIRAQNRAYCDGGTGSGINERWLKIKAQRCLTLYPV